MNIVNAVGDDCPLPVIKAKKALSEMESGTLEVLVDKKVSVENISRFAEASGHSCDVTKSDGVFHIRIEKNGAGKKSADFPAECAPAGKTVVVLSSDTMGEGDDELGRILMKGFVFALTQLDTLPEAILLYNGGARLSVEGSAALSDLIALEKAGTRILTCGTCLNHFEIADRLSVGSVTNMYSIVDEMAGASRILRP